MRALLEGERRVALPFAQIEVASGRAIGITTYRDVDERNRTLEIGGTWLGRPWWRSAINTEAKLLFLGHAFDALRANRALAGGDRAPGRRARGRAPPSDDPAGRFPARHGAVLGAPRGVAGGPRAPPRPARRP